MSADFQARVAPFIKAAGALKLSRPWVERAGLPLRPHSEALFAERRAGRCAVCDRPLPPGRPRSGVAMAQAAGAPRQICSWAATAPCRREVEKLLQEDQRARGRVVYRSVIAVLAVALHPELLLMKQPSPKALQSSGARRRLPSNPMRQRAPWLPPCIGATPP